MDNPVNVLITLDINDKLVRRIEAISPRLQVTRQVVHAAAEIPPDVWDEVNVLFTGSVLPDREMAPNLRWVQVISAGVDSFLDNALFEDREVILTTASGIHAVTMAEYALAMMLAFAHHLPLMFKRQAAHDWPKNREKFKLFEAVSLREATLGIVGYGSIGRELARLARAFGMEVLAIKRDAMSPASKDEYALAGTGDPDGSMAHRLYPPQALKSMCKECDYVVLLMPRTPETEGMFDADVIAAMKPGAVLINLGRGGIVDEEALLNALESGALGGAAFDVFATEPLPDDSPLWDAPNFIISPHIAGSMPNYYSKAADVFVQNLERFLANQDLINVVRWERGY